ncbi:acyl-CoA dehydrogenase family protein [Prosthecobacter sp.]|uniref:acyl-CoA dehydrogenase family protein n=1 Tax=Prosthecobacter sp. TaxID=1965333 RepID=UPI001D660BED|nr:acyl-CoA dehydrogenase family protein [Prosthecobacter sp.]MCB1275340.1 acyl-CoA dehydrogenase family protein [Prosthecobacter sp.]
MKTTLEENKTEKKTLIDTSRMNAGQRAALEMAEAARDERRNTGLAAGIFFGEPDFDKLLPFPKQSVEDHDQGDAFLHRLELVLDKYADPDAIDATGEISDVLLGELAMIGAFGIKIPVKYGGLGLSQTNYSRAAMLLGSRCGNLAALLSAHQSIGAPQPLILFGTEEQKAKYLPRCAKGEISAFALTENDVGSDPARMKTEAKLDADGTHYILNGEKLWCTNGTKAGMIVVMAKTPTAEKPHATTAFIVETNWPGVDILHRCRFMGLKALYNGVIHFENVRVPVANVLGGVGRGLKVALTTLNTGRITLPAACTGLSKRCLEISTRWARSREQWGQPIGRHAAIADKLSRMAADTFAMEGVVRYVSAMVDRDKNADVRLEAAIGKLWGSEKSWRIMDDTMQMRGGRGFETAASLKARGDVPEPVERLFRDSRINTIFEGSSEIMRLFIAREALEPHLRLGAEAVNPTLSWKVRAKAALRAARFYSLWYPMKWLPFGAGDSRELLHPALQFDLDAIARLSRVLARRLFLAMAMNGPKLEKRQILLGHFVDVGAELFVWSCALAHAQFKVNDSSMPEVEIDKLVRLVRFFGRTTRERIATSFRHIKENLDAESWRVAQEV